MVRFLIILVPFLLPIRELAAQTAKSQQIDKLVSKLFSKKQFNGAVVAGERGHVIYSRGFGYANFEAGLPFTPEIPSDGGSIAKTMTATAILLLQEMGKLQLDDPVEKFLPDYPYEGTRIRDLISHSTGGLPDYDYFFNRIGKNESLSNETMAAILAKEQPALPIAPGSDFIYDSPGFDLAALVAAKISGESFADFLAHNFFEPLGMENAFIRPAFLHAWTLPRTVGYRYQADTLQHFDITDREGFHGGSNVWVSAFDLYQWGTAFYGENGLNSSLREEAVKPVAINGKWSSIVQGAWYKGRHKDAFYYWGNLYGFYCFVYWDRTNEFTLAFVNNVDMPQLLRPRFTAALISIMEGHANASATMPERAITAPASYSGLAGSYLVKGVGQIHLFIKEGLYLKAPNGLHYRMFPVGEDVFYVPGVECWISFGQTKKQPLKKIYWESPNLLTHGKRTGSL